jgi:hypothetical protein
MVELVAYASMLLLADPSVVAGKVEDEFGRPVEGAVVADSLDSAYRRVSISEVPMTTCSKTNGRGEFHLQKDPRQDTGIVFATSPDGKWMGWGRVDHRPLTIRMHPVLPVEIDLEFLGFGRPPFYRFDVYKGRTLVLSGESDAKKLAFALPTGAYSVRFSSPEMIEQHSAFMSGKPTTPVRLASRLQQY